MSDMSAIVDEVVISRRGPYRIEVPITEVNGKYSAVGVAYEKTRPSVMRVNKPIGEMLIRRNSQKIIGLESDDVEQLKADIKAKIGGSR
jgi:hypothetical protein